MPVETVPPTDYQRELEAEVAEAFCARLYNNVIFNRQVYTGAKEGKWAKRKKKNENNTAHHTRKLLTLCT